MKNLGKNAIFSLMIIYSMSINIFLDYLKFNKKERIKSNSELIVLLILVFSDL